MLQDIVLKIDPVFFEVQKVCPAVGGQPSFMSHLVVSHFVVVEVARCCKSLSTNTTLVRLLSAVNSPANRDVSALSPFSDS